MTAGFEDRLRAEYRECLDRHQKLKEFTLTDEFLALPFEDQTLIRQQIVTMGAFRRTLKARVDRLPQPKAG